MSFLEQHLDRIYMEENFEKSFPMVKARSKAIFDSMKEGNLIKARALLNKLPDVGMEEVAYSAQKRNPKRYAEAKRYIRGETTELQKFYILSYTALRSIQSLTKDKVTFQSIEDAISDLNDFSKKYWGQFISKGFSLTVLLAFIGWIFGRVPIVGHLIGLGGLGAILLFWIGVLLMVVRAILNTYFSLRGMK